MKILFLNEYASPHVVSGAEYSMMALAESLSKYTKVYTLSPDLSKRSNLASARSDLNVKFPFPKKIKPGGVLSPLWFNNPLFWLYASWQIFRATKRLKIDLIHVHGKYILPAAVIAGWFTRKPVVITVRDFKFLCPLALCFTHQQKTCSLAYYLTQEIPEYRQRYAKTALIRLVLAKLWQYRLKWWLKRCNQVICVSPQLKQIYDDNGIKNTIAIYNLPPSKQTLTLKKNQDTVLSVGRLSYGKGTDSLLKAAKILPQFKFILAGPKSPSLKTAFPPNCHYLGVVSHRQTAKLYRQADVFVILSRWPEPLSRAALEALSFGLPIIASDRGGNQAVVRDNGNGFLVDPDKPQQVAAKINQLLTVKNFNQWRQNSHKLLATRFNRQKIIQKHLDLYRSLI